MNKIKKKILIISISLLFLFIIIGILIYHFNKPNIFNGVKLYDKKFESLKIDDIEIKEEDSEYKFKANIKSYKDNYIKYIKIIIKDKNDKEIVSLIGYVNKNMKKDETATIRSNTNIDITKIDKIEYEIVR